MLVSTLSTSHMTDTTVRTAMTYCHSPVMMPTTAAGAQVVAEGQYEGYDSHPPFREHGR